MNRLLVLVLVIFALWLSGLSWFAFIGLQPQDDSRLLCKDALERKQALISVFSDIRWNYVWANEGPNNFQFSWMSDQLSNANKDAQLYCLSLSTP